MMIRLSFVRPCYPSVAKCQGNDHSRRVQLVYLLLISWLSRPEGTREPRLDGGIRRSELTWVINASIDTSVCAQETQR